MIRLRQAQGQNPLTHLPANDAILDFIGRACAERGVGHVFCHLDFDYFKPFNDVYGFHVGDRAIIMFAELLRSELGGDNVLRRPYRRAMISSSAAPASVSDLEARLLALRDRFASDAESLYAQEHRLNGYLECAGRDGVVARFPLLTCSLALLHLPAGRGAMATAEIAQELARLKTVAKKSESGFSVATLDRREAELGCTAPVPERAMG